MKNARHTVLVLLTIVVVVGAMAVTFHYKGNWHDLKLALQTAHWGYAPLAVLAGLLVYPVKALRWTLILGRNQNARYRTLLSAVMIGFMANCIVSRLGELIRAAVMSMKGELRTSTALASIALERVFDICTVVVFLILALQWLGPSSISAANAETVRRLTGAKVFLGLVLAATVAFLVLLRLFPQWMTRLLERFVRMLPRRVRDRIEEFLQTFLRGLDTLRSWRQVAAILALSAVHWGLQVLFFLLAGYCFPHMAITVPVALLIFAVVAFGVAGLPLPGYIGIYQIAVLAAGAIVGMQNQEQQAAWVGYSWLSWALNIPFVILVGFIFLWKENLSLSGIRKQADLPTETTA
jgi:uncharacterized protein (TIRG00374 family)